MSVVQRVQRLYPIPPEPIRAAIPPVVAPIAQAKGRRVDAEALCAGGLLLADLAAFALVLTSVSLLLPPGSRGTWVAPGGTATLVSLGCAFAAGMIGYFSTHAHYEQRLPFWTETRDVAAATLATLVMAAAAAYFLNLPIPKEGLLAVFGALPLALVGLRRVARHGLTSAGLWRIPVVVVGAGGWAEQAERTLHDHAGLGYDVVGRETVPDHGRSWNELLRSHCARMLILAHDTESRLPTGLIAALVRERVPYALLPQMDGLPVVGSRQTYLGRETVMVSYRNNLRKPVARAMKIAFDLAAASAALVVLAPVMLIVAALVGLDGGPVFFGHKRIGAQGRVFRCLKFRSMVTDSDAALQRLFERDPAAALEWAATHKLRDDPRVTWIGRILRKTSLDELPQLFNVLRLEMSLVGPRPIVSLEIPKYAEDIAYYYETRPGITGLWQVSGRSDTTYAQRVRLDSWYVKNWTLWQDLSIIARTIPAVLSGRGAG
jgi:undecaprenyl-phosphate galactose phosphotransferase